MNKYRIIVFVLLAFVSVELAAQKLQLRSKELGLNMSPLISQIIPFSNGTRLSGPFGLMYRTGRNNRYFNMELGVQIFNNNDSQNNYFNLALGFLTKKALGEKWNFYNSYNFLVSSGSFNEPNDPSNDSNGGSLGLSYAAGLEYKLKESIYIGTETHLFIGTSDESLRIHIIPPVGLFIILKLN